MSHVAVLLTSFIYVGIEEFCYEYLFRIVSSVCPIQDLSKPFSIEQFWLYMSLSVYFTWYVWYSINILPTIRY